MKTGLTYKQTELRQSVLPFTFLPNKRPFLVRRLDRQIPCFALALNKYAHLSSQAANPFVVRSGQLDVALGVVQRLMPQPFCGTGI